MAKIPESVQMTYPSNLLMNHGMRCEQGKTADTYRNRGRLLLVRTNRLSIFDIVLKREVPRKGEVLTANTIWWTEFFKDVGNQLVACGPAMDPYLPPDFRGLPDLQKQSMLVEDCGMFGVECIARGYLTGSGLKNYNKTGKVCGIELPPGLHDGSQLPEPIFTPSTKSQTGHDENISEEVAAAIVGKSLLALLKDMTLYLYKQACLYAAERGIVIADTKFEFGRNKSRAIVLCDEILTPDSSRFWLKTDWEAAAAKNKSPKGYDKQLVRDYGDSLETPFFKDGVRLKFSQLEPTNDEHVAWVHTIEWPDEVIEETSQRYQGVFEMLTGKPLDQFQKEDMGIES